MHTQRDLLEAARDITHFIPSITKTDKLTYPYVGYKNWARNHVQLIDKIGVASQVNFGVVWPNEKHSESLLRCMQLQGILTNSIRGLFWKK